jgi:hypothetical protein
MVFGLQGARIMPHNLAYVLARAVVVLIGWCVMYFFLTALSTHVPLAVVYMLSIAWLLAGVVCFGYIYKLRHDLGTLPHQQAAAAAAAAQPPAPPPTARDRFYAALAEKTES